MNSPVFIDPNDRASKAKNYFGFAKYMQSIHGWTDGERAQAHMRFISYEKEETDFSTSENLRVAFNCNDDHINQYLKSISPETKRSELLAAFFETKRIENFMSYPEMAKFSHVNIDSIKKICKFKNGSRVNEKTIFRLCHAFNCKVSDIDLFNVERDAIVINRNVLANFLIAHRNSQYPLMTQLECADLISIDQRSMSELENGVRNVSPSTLNKICVGLKIDQHSISDFGKGRFVFPSSNDRRIVSEISVYRFSEFINSVCVNNDLSLHDLAATISVDLDVIQSHVDVKCPKVSFSLFQSMCSQLNFDFRTVASFLTISTKLSAFEKAKKTLS